MPPLTLNAPLSATVSAPLLKWPTKKSVPPLAHCEPEPVMVTELAPPAPMMPLKPLLTVPPESTNIVPEPRSPTTI